MPVRLAQNDTKDHQSEFEASFWSNYSNLTRPIPPNDCLFGKGDPLFYFRESGKVSEILFHLARSFVFGRLRPTIESGAALKLNRIGCLLET